jgi:hypothetical protein
MSKNAFAAIMKTKQSSEETSTGYFIIKGKETKAHLLQFDGASEFVYLEGIFYSRLLVDVLQTLSQKIFRKMVHWVI